MTSLEENVFARKLINHATLNADYNALEVHMSILIFEYCITHYDCHNWQQMKKLMICCISTLSCKMSNQQNWKNNFIFHIPSKISQSTYNDV